MFDVGSSLRTVRRAFASTSVVVFRGRKPVCERGRWPFRTKDVSVFYIGRRPLTWCQVMR